MNSRLVGVARLARTVGLVLACAALGRGTASGQDCATVTKYQAAEEKANEAELQLKILLKAQKKPETKRLTGDLTAQLQTAKADVVARTSALADRNSELEKAQKAKKDYDDKKGISSLQKTIADLTRKIEALEKSRGDATAQAVDKLEAERTKIGSRLSDELSKPPLESTDRTRNAINEAATTATARIDAYKVRNSTAHGGETNTATLEPPALQCPSITNLLPAIANKQQDLITKRAAKNSYNRSGVFQETEESRRTLDELNGLLQTLQSEVANCERQALNTLTELERKNLEIEKADPERDVRDRETKLKTMRESRAVAQDQVKVLAEEGTALAENLSRAGESVASAEQALLDAENLVLEIQKNSDVADATKKRDDLKPDVQAAEQRKNEAKQQAQENLTNTDTRMATARATFTATSMKPAQTLPDVIAAYKSLVARWPSLDKAQRQQEKERFQRLEQSRANAIVDAEMLKVGAAESTRLLKISDGLQEFDCWVDIAPLRAQLAARATQASGGASLVRGQDFEFSNDTGWETAPFVEPLDDEMPDDIEKYTTEERIFPVKPGQWLSTGIQLKKGERFEVSATGTVKADASWRNREWGPNGFYWLGFSAYTLKGLVSDKLIEIGGSWGGTAPADGELKLGITRTYEKINAEDSGFTGSFRATVTIYKPKS